VRETAEGLVERDAALEGFGGHEEIVLLFEHDLYDQLQLVQVLDRLLRWDLGDTRLSLGVADEYLGNFGPEGLRALFLGRHGATGEGLELASRAWEAFRSPDPTRLSTLAPRRPVQAPVSVRGLQRHCWGVTPFTIVLQIEGKQASRRADPNR
jgi:hypothetical protein